ncbi:MULTISPECIES: DUF397 domain-containing protein [Streptomycetaceae]|uniref:DUF397 domain-containing protein n=1 Tax=Streptantibioticus cattleyicolor (strain ATCC 35852 / DSM 46488 / JCM 4925 / NBRC 14057 / NRRL 8057) TaxID=1003195 RepID=F8JWH0_STREN|nr:MULTISPECIES: DUF397 domain-containing protein [Streptomycetaceae]AEW95750.1 hypothetical protein SCATT_33790 [Streptantibioticus cattleyicolor NRRL 8057 = DSM 46488]MYS60295.1 DUF397 domain-containing protein [Streptomyces sp. SID5468]CCB76090.1 protein of unknown function [Streptantibioticus cattleyicolor NRRL 8057 = DSM 46488]
MRRPTSSSEATTTWFKSSYSGGSGTECVEAAVLTEGMAVRDSKDPEGPVLTFAPGAWADFLDAIREDTLS